jgi:hypothetical protein
MEIVGVLKFLDIHIICYSILYCKAIKTVSGTIKVAGLASKPAARGTRSESVNRKLLLGWRY